jgi:uncharacterized protein YciI
MRYVALLDHGPNWKPGRSIYEQGTPIVEHLTTMRQRYDTGSLLLGGPFADHDGGIAVLDVANETAAIELLEADPAVAAGVLTYTLREVIPYFDVYAGTRTDDTVAELGARRRDARGQVPAHAKD